MQVKLYFVQIALIVVLIFAVFFAGYQTAISINSPAHSVHNYVTDSNIPLVYYQFNLKAVDGNGVVIFNDSNVFADGTPALSAMQKMTSIGFNQDPSYGAFITSINGIKANGSDWWGLYLDGNESSVGISYIVINKPTSIELQLCNSWPCAHIFS